MNQIVKTILDKLVALASNRSFGRIESLYRISARRHGVQFVGFFERHRLALFQDPVTGSSFAVRQGETIASGINRVRARFGFTD